MRAPLSIGLSCLLCLVASHATAQAPQPEEPVAESFHDAEAEREHVMIEPFLEDSPALSMVQAHVLRYDEGETIPVKGRMLQLVLYVSADARSASPKCNGVELRADRAVLRAIRTAWTTVDGSMVIANFPLRALDTLAKAKAISGKVCRDAFRLAPDAAGMFAALRRASAGEPELEDVNEPVADQEADPDSGEDVVRVSLETAERPDLSYSVFVVARVIRGREGKPVPPAKRELELVVSPQGDGSSATPKCLGLSLRNHQGPLRPIAVRWSEKEEGAVARFPLKVLHTLAHSRRVQGSLCRDQFELGRGFRRLLRALEKAATSRSEFEEDAGATE